MSAKPVSIIVLCHNRWAETRRCLDSLRRSTPPELYDLLVCDNASTDGTLSRLLSLRRSWPGLKVLKNECNLPFAQALNHGMRAVSGEFFLWLNNDTILSPGWLEGLLGAARSDRGVAAVGPVTERIAAPEQLAAQAFPEDRAVEAAFLGGFCFLLRREAAQAVGLLDERFVWGWEDIDYCLRLRQAGWRLALVRQVLVSHAGSRTLQGVPASERRAADMMNRRLLLTKWFGHRPGHAELRELFRKTPAPWDDRRCPRASIVVLCRGDWGRARDCLEALRRLGSGTAYEVLAADVGPGGRCLARLARLSRDWAELRVLGRWDGAPYADAVNRALAQAQGDCFVLLSDGARPTTGWIEGLAKAAEAEPNIGMVAPRSDGAVPGWQAARRGKAAGLPRPAPYLRGPCLLIPRRVFERAGSLDDRLLGEAAQVDYSLRLLQAGYQVVVAEAVFVGQRSKGGRPSPARRGKDQEDARLLFKKWAGNALFLPVSRG